MQQLPVFSALRQVPEFDSRDELRAAVAHAVPTLGRLVTVATPVRTPANQAEPASGFSMSGFG
jgi:hypothetical protein